MANDSATGVFDLARVAKDAKTSGSVAYQKYATGIKTALYHTQDMLPTPRCGVARSVFNVRVGLARRVNLFGYGR